jgi:hypothetical protein
MRPSFYDNVIGNTTQCNQTAPAPVEAPSTTTPAAEPSEPTVSNPVVPSTTTPAAEPLEPAVSNPVVPTTDWSTFDN